MSVLSRFFYGIQTNCNSATGDLLNLQYGYSATANNGNVQSQAITRGSQTWTDSYSYDGANRLNGASEGSGSWGQSFGFDGRGNRWLSSYSGLATPTAEVPLTASWYNANNQVGSWSYDGSGNILSIANMQRAFTYDAENRQVSAAINGQTTTYTYDGDGRRVIKVAPSVGTTVFVYDPFGNLAQEYGTPTDSGTKYLTTDALGSTRLVTNLDGSVEKSYDYLPFGEEIESGTAGRGTTFPGSPYPHSPATQDLEFTSKERDSETGLDYFGARYMSSAQGRFTSVDPVFATASLFNPQSWNGYTYTLNNPLKYVDDDGHIPILAITAAGGALIGGAVGAAREYQHQIQESGHITSSGRIWTAAGGGALAGGLAGLTLGIGAGTAAAAGAVETGIVIGSSTVVGDFAQHRANDALGLTNPGENETELPDTLVDAATSGLAGAGAGKLADKLVPIPNVRKEIELLKFASRRSTRAVRIQSAQSNAALKALGNTAIGNGVGAAAQQTMLFFRPGSQQQQQKPSKGCVTTDAVGGGKETTCQ